MLTASQDSVRSHTFTEAECNLKRQEWIQEPGLADHAHCKDKQEDSVVCIQTVKRATWPRQNSIAMSEERCRNGARWGPHRYEILWAPGNWCLQLWGRRANRKHFITECNFCKGKMQDQMAQLSKRRESGQSPEWELEKSLHNQCCKRKTKLTCLT